MGDRRQPVESLSELSVPERVVMVAYLFVFGAFEPVAFVLAALAAMLSWRPGAYLLVAVLLLRFVVRDLATGVAMRREGELDDVSRPERISLALGFGSYLLALAGSYAALAGARAGAALIVVGLGGHFAGHVAAGIGAYRRVMVRPWPAVVPLPDEDDDW